jgi:hypothetical protein
MIGFLSLWELQFCALGGVLVEDESTAVLANYAPVDAA